MLISGNVAVHKVWTGFIWLRIGTSGRLHWTQYWTFGFYERQGISWL